MHIDIIPDPLQIQLLQDGFSPTTPDAPASGILKAAHEAAQKEIKSLKPKIAALKIHKFGLKHFSSDNDSIKFYTGFLSYQHFYNFCHFVEPSAQHMNYVYSAGLQASGPSAQNMLLIVSFSYFWLELGLAYVSRIYLIDSLSAPLLLVGKLQLGQIIYSFY